MTVLEYLVESGSIIPSESRFKIETAIAYDFHRHFNYLPKQVFRQEGTEKFMVIDYPDNANVRHIMGKVVLYYQQGMKPEYISNMPGMPESKIDNPRKWGAGELFNEKLELPVSRIRERVFRDSSHNTPRKKESRLEGKYAPSDEYTRRRELRDYAG